MKKISLLFLLTAVSIHVMAQQVITVNDRMVEEEKKPKTPGKNIIKINPQQKTIIVSGFSESDRVKEAKRLGAGAYVRKPYIKEKLGMAVKKELGDKR